MITFENITIKYDDFTAVENLNFEVKDGEFFTFLGPSGCGKTTTLRALVGLNYPTSGRILVNGKDITKLPTEKRDIKMVFQSYALFPTMTVFENIAFGPKVKKWKKQSIEGKVHEIASKVDLDVNQLQKKVSELSGGQQQRVAIARALVNEPSILVLDEPLSNLDAKLRVQLRNELKHLQKNVGITTIYVTHDQEEALTLSDRIAVFNKGKIEQIGTPDEIYEQSLSEFVCNFIGDNNQLTSLVSKYPDRFSLLNQTDFSKFYSRIERLKIIPESDSFDMASDEVMFEGEIIDFEYYGLYTKYSIMVEGTTLHAVSKEKLQKDMIENKKVKIILSQNDILQYK
ncbi:ABC transporter ATP-binding protein [Oceanobacillus piezotolerans]|uniref:ABC transporter ATP-binding protein n=1 Tax=Oceanobacillus piezotolerans TaxID=2448030 RepID=A0A498DBB9_9BACI|nr:ABC transporter ATP-binding protein [Oceanobacillus piezotolerans]RLL46984.1 ABC transporter ATP-binding protein [Oceanobacillus piezotolerans]